MERLVSIGEAASALGVSVTTLRRWEVSGKLIANSKNQKLLDGVKKAVEESQC